MILLAGFGIDIRIAAIATSDFCLNCRLTASKHPDFVSANNPPYECPFSLAVPTDSCGGLDPDPFLHPLLNSARIRRDGCSLAHSLRWGVARQREESHRSV